MLSAVSLEKQFGGHVVLDGVSFSVQRGERVALVGANGSGKTTLLKLLGGFEVADGGQVAIGPNVRLGYLGQEGVLSPDRTLQQELEAVFSGVQDLEQQIRTLEVEMGELEGPQLEQVMERYDRVRTRYEHADPATVPARISKVAAGLGFRPKDLQKTGRQLSGGWQMRGAMARLLLDDPDCLLLDEPTNHLDLEAMEWLEEYLRTVSGAVLMVSHDRVFLDRTVKRCLELRHGDLEEYPGNYSFYLEEAERRREARLARYKNQQKKLAQERRFIERFRYKAALASRVKSREKMLARREMEAPPEARSKSLRMGFQQSHDSAHQVLKVQGLYKAFGDQSVLSDLDLCLERGQRLAVVGLNGAGKSTLLKILSGRLEPDQGRIVWGDEVEVATFDQHQAESLRGDNTVLEEVESVAPGRTTQTEVRTLLGCFLFTGDDVFKRVEVLSGGEKSRVALTRCVLRPSNVLLLDEPTNHLDIESREALLDALLLYEGTVILVTHDRALMGRLADRVLDLSAPNGPELFVGNYFEFREKRAKEDQERRRRQAALRAEEAAAKKKAQRTAAGSRRNKGAGSTDRASKVPWKLEALEKKIFELEARLEVLGCELAEPELYLDPQRQSALASEYQSLQAELSDLLEVWERLTD